MRKFLLIGMVLVLGGCSSSQRGPRETGAFTPDFEPPALIRTERVTMAPLGPEHAALDYAAFMGSREHLRRTLHWGTWPSDDMTVERNRGDLARHAAEFEAHEAYAYTVLTPDETACVGCVYFEPDEEAGPRSASMAYWVVEDRLADDLDVHVVSSFLAAVDREFPIDEVSIMVHHDDERGGMVMLEAGLVEVDSSSEQHDRYLWTRVD